MRRPGDPLPPIRPAVRWAGRAIGWAGTAAGLACWAAGDPGVPPGLAWWLGALTVAAALETHRWLPTQNTVAAALLTSGSCGLAAVALGERSGTGLALVVLGGFSHLMIARGIVRRLLRPWRSGSFYGFGVLAGTTMVATISSELTRTLAGRPATLAGWVGHGIGLGLAVLTASVWLLVKKPVPEVPNPHPALLWLAWTAVQSLALAATGHRAAAAAAAVIALVAVVAWCALSRNVGGRGG